VTDILSHELPTYLAERRAARRSERVVQLVAAVLAVAAVVGASLLVEPMNRVRLDSQLVIDPDTVRGLPPIETLLARTGTFRAVAIQVAFARAERLKQDGKYYELKELADSICRLAPRFPSVWSFHAWNQAYNISVATYTAEQRWKWVNNGIALLRDRGIPYNPKSVTLYKELAWIYWHKVGDFLDDHHWNYKEELAVEMERVLGAPPPAMTEQEEIDRFRRIVEAPRDLERMLREDPEMAALAARLGEVELTPDATLLEFVARHLRDEISLARYLKTRTEEEAYTLFGRQMTLLSEPESAAARERLLAALRSAVLRERYHMDVDWMLALMERYGPIDWRSPFAMALYWASFGDMETRGQLNLNPHDAMNTGRFIFFALDNMVKRGKIVLAPNFDRPNESYLELLPDPRFIDHYHRTVLEVSAEQFPDDRYVAEGQTARQYRIGHFNFLHYAIPQLYFSGDPASVGKAEKYYRYLRDVNRNPDGSPKAQYFQPLREFVMQDLRDAAAGFKTANMLVAELMMRSLRELAAGDAEKSVAAVELAREVHAYYQKDPAQDRNTRRQLEKLSIIRRDVAERYLRDPHIPIALKARVWLGLELRTRQMVWDRVSAYLTEFCAFQQPPWDVEEAFPEPPGMVEYRLNPEQGRRERQSDVSEGEKL